MICVSIQEFSAEECLNSLRGVDFAEIRLDKMAADMDGIKKIFSRHPRLIATCRPGTMADEKRLELLSKGIEAGAAFIDVEVDSEEEFKNSIIEKARAKGCRVIVSYHNFRMTPQRSELEHIVNLCFDSGADMAKIACKVRTEKDNALLLGLLQDQRLLVIVGLGEKGKITRLVAPLLGSPFTYASHAKGKETAEGQLDKKSLERALRNLRNV